MKEEKLTIKGTFSNTFRYFSAFGEENKGLDLYRKSKFTGYGFSVRMFSGIKEGTEEASGNSPFSGVPNRGCLRLFY
jgi:hypothetical protein